MSEQFTKEYLAELQGYPLSMKLALTRQRIREWVHRYGTDGVYVSFSGWKDSTVLLHIVREMYPDVPAVFADTGLEYPEIRQFVRTFDNVEWVKPKMNFRQVIQKYGYPFASKTTAECISQSVKWCEKMKVEKPYSVNSIKYKERGMPHRLAQLNGIYERNWGEKKNTLAFNSSDLSAAVFQKKKWLFALDAPFLIGSNCCHLMKREPIDNYQKSSGRFPITAQMAKESIARERTWLRYGCNAFNTKIPKSNPMSFWTEQDVLYYLRGNNIQIASVYGEIDIDDDEQVKGQMHITDLGLCERNVDLKTTGCKRTGCMFCGFGCHLEKEGEGRFERLKVTHPKIYDYIMRPWEQGGLNYKEVIDWLNEHGNLHIRY